MRYIYLIEFDVADEEAFKRVTYPGSSGRYGPNPEDVDADPPMTVADDFFTDLQQRVVEATQHSSLDPVGISVVAVHKIRSAMPQASVGSHSWPEGQF